MPTSAGGGDAMITAGADEALLHSCFLRAREHAFYRERFHGLDDPRDAPPTSKETLLECLAAFAPGEEARGVYLVRSGGSTQAPLIFPVDIDENNAQRRVLAEHMSGAGIFCVRSVALNLFGYSDLYRTAAIFDDLLERCQATTLPMSAHARYEDMFAIARRFRPTHLLGTPSKLTLFAQYLREVDEILQIPQLLYGGELLRETTLALLREKFGTQQVWSLYGGAETGIWAWCDATRQPGLFRMLPGMVVEIISPDSDGFGALAVTNSYRKRFPVFRYLVGDVGRLIEHGGERLLELRGRNSRSFQFAEMTYDLDMFTSFLDDAQSFQMQLRFDERGRDRLELLVCNPKDTDTMRGISTAFTQFLNRTAPQGLFAIRVAQQGELYRDPVTTKTPLIMDFRR
jgi:phenylacetate-CoA ligase